MHLIFFLGLLRGIDMLRSDFSLCAKFPLPMGSGTVTLWLEKLDLMLPRKQSQENTEKLTATSAKGHLLFAGL